MQSKSTKTRRRGDGVLPGETIVPPAINVAVKLSEKFVYISATSHLTAHKEPGE